eukprot:864118-Amorphochlora_amoeboformis.AAC.1
MECGDCFGSSGSGRSRMVVNLTQQERSLGRDGAMAESNGGGLEVSVTKGQREVEDAERDKRGRKRRDMESERE